MPYYDENLICHGDQECPAPLGVACLVRSRPRGFATRMTSPYHTSATVNDVRVRGSAPLSFYVTIALRGVAVDGEDAPSALTPLTQIILGSVGEANLYTGTWPAPADAPAIVWNEGHFPLAGKVKWNYIHTHEAWMETVHVWTGASAGALGARQFDGLGARTEGRARHARLPHTETQRWVSRRAAAVGASLACKWDRSTAAFEVINGTVQLDDVFNRKSPFVCSSFLHVRAGEPWVGISYLSPASHAAARPSVDMHSWIYVFVASNDTDAPSLGSYAGWTRPADDWLGLWPQPGPYSGRPVDKPWIPSNLVALWNLSPLAVVMGCSLLLLALRGVCACCARCCGKPAPPTPPRPILV